MKRILSLALSALLLLTLLSGCGNGGEAATTGPQTIDAFSVGYGCVVANPQESVPLGGYNDSLERWSISVQHNFSVICVAFTDEDNNTVLMITLDLLLAFNNFAKPLRTAVSEATGIPYDNVMLHTDHNHSGPDMLLQDQGPIATFTKQVQEAAVQAATDALADRKPAQMYATYCRPEKHNTVRHYLLADGNFQAEGVGAVPKSELIGHATYPDNLLQLVKFTREGGKDVVMINWQGHPPGTSPSTIATGNYYQVVREYLAANLDCLPVFVLGGSGNLNNSSQIPGEILHEGYIELGEALGAEAVKAAENFTQLETGKLLFKHNPYVTLNNNLDNSTVNLYALAIGDFAMVFAPFEIFDTNAVAVRESSDFKMTFYASCSNNSRGYLPTPMSFDWEIAYEVRITNYPKGTAEAIQGQLEGMLDELYAQTGKTPEPKPEGYLSTVPEPKTDGVTYMIPSGNPYRQVNNGFYAMAVVNGSSFKNILFRDEETAKLVCSKTEAKLLFDYQGVVVGIAD